MIFFGIEYILQEVLKKSKIKQSLTIYLEHKIINILFVDFIVSLSSNICLQDNLRLHQFIFSK